MKTLLLFLLLASSGFADSVAVSLAGTVTNTTGEIAAAATLDLVQDGETMRAQLVTFPPLTGTGTLTGRCLDGWCELSGELDGGFTLRFRGVFNGRDFRGTYTVIRRAGQMQYGHFVFSKPARPPAPTAKQSSAPLLQAVSDER